MLFHSDFHVSPQELVPGADITLQNVAICHTHAGSYGESLASRQSADTVYNARNFIEKADGLGMFH